MKKISKRNTKKGQNRYGSQKLEIFQIRQNYKQTTNTLDTRNIEHFLSDRIPKRKKQYRDECPNTTKRLDYTEEKKDISK